MCQSAQFPISKNVSNPSNPSIHRQRNGKKFPEAYSTRETDREKKTKCLIICCSRQPALATACLQLLLQIRSHNSPQYGPSASPRNRTPVGEVVAMFANDPPLKTKAASIISNSSRLFHAAIQPMLPDSETGIIRPNRQSVTKSFVICFVGW